MDQPASAGRAPRSPLARRTALLGLFAQGLSAVQGASRVRQTLTRSPMLGQVWICAIGKAAESMALGAADALMAQQAGGLVITKRGHADPARLDRLGIQVLIAGHPVPDQTSLDAGQALVTAIEALPDATSLLFLLSGGASSLVEVTAPGVGLAELQEANAWLLASGLPIREMNLVRKALSRIKAGGLLHAIGGRPVRSLAISDVPGDSVAVIGSGLLVPDPDLAQSLAHLALPDWLGAWVAQGLEARGDLPTEGPGIEIVASLSMAQSAIATAAERQGLAVCLHPSPIQGDAADQGSALARSLMAGAPGLHIWGGETTVRLPSTAGRGGRNQHLALAAAIELAGSGDCALLSAGTDGTDGPTEDAGALVDGGTLERATLDGLDARDSLRRADSGRLLEASGDLIRTGPTGTNVMDLILGLKT